MTEAEILNNIVIHRKGKPMTLQLSNQEIIQAYKRHGNINQTSLALGVSWDLVRNAVNGTRKEPKKRERADKGDLCHCCGLNRIDKAGGLTRFCRDCFENASCGEIYPDVGVYCW